MVNLEKRKLRKRGGHGHNSNFLVFEMLPKRREEKFFPCTEIMAMILSDRKIQIEPQENLPNCKNSRTTEEPV